MSLLLFMYCTIDISTLSLYKLNTFLNVTLKITSWKRDCLGYVMQNARFAHSHCMQLHVDKANQLIIMKTVRFKILLVNCWLICGKKFYLSELAELGVSKVLRAADITRILLYLRVHIHHWIYKTEMNFNIVMLAANSVAKLIIFVHFVYCDEAT